MEQIKIGQFIACKRKEKGLTQEQLAEKLGVTNKVVSKWENGKCVPDLSSIQPLCEIIGVSPPTLLNGEENWTDDFVMNQLWTIEGLKKLFYTVIGLVVCNVPYIIADIPFISDIPSGTFLRGFVNSAFVGLKMVGVALFVYGLIKYTQSRQQQKKEISE